MKKIAAVTAGAVLASLLIAANTHAHGIWFAQRATQLALIYGVGADDLDAVKRLPLIESVAGYDTEWNAVPTELKVAGPLVLVVSDGLPVVVSAVLNNGIWSKTPAGEWLKKGRDEVPDAVIAEKTFKYAVHVRGKLESKIPNLPKQTLQLVPVANKLPAMMGDDMKVKVLFQGKPVEGAAIKTDFVNDPDAVPLKTAADGTVTIKVRNQGLNVIAAIYDGPADEPKRIDKIEHLATLSFVLEHLPE